MPADTDVRRALDVLELDSAAAAVYCFHTLHAAKVEESSRSATVTPHETILAPSCALALVTCMHACLIIPGRIPPPGRSMRDNRRERSRKGGGCFSTFFFSRFTWQHYARQHANAMATPDRTVGLTLTTLIITMRVLTIVGVSPVTDTQIRD